MITPMEAADVRRLSDRLVAACAADDRLVAALLYGSHAAGTADALSDVDFGIVTTDAAHDEVIRDRERVVRALGKPLLLEDFGDPTNLHAILAEGPLVELVFARASELRLEGPSRVLLDKGGVVDAAAAREPPPREVPAEADEVRRLIAWFWHDVGHVTAALGRGHLLWAHGQLEELRAVCLHLARFAAGIAIEDEPYWNVDEALNEGQLAALRETIVRPEPGPMLDAALALVRLYRELATPLLARHDLAYPTELDRLMTARLERVANTSGARGR
jgi:lincosamide nucleotidyltransferase B/F